MCPSSAALFKTCWPAALTAFSVTSRRLTIGARTGGWASLLFIGTAHAQLPPPEQSEPSATSTSSPWSVSGFGTLGALRQWGGGDKWRFSRSSSQVGATSRLSVTQDTRLGGQVNWNGGPRWDATLQAVAMHTPSGTPWDESILYGNVGYRPWSDTRIRFGRSSSDLFLFSDSRNVGYSLLWARPPVDFYGFVPMASIDGIDLEQRWSFGETNWRLRMTAGAVKGSAVDAVGTRVPLRGTNALAVGLTREDQGLLLKLSYLRSRLSLDTGPQVAALRQSLDAVAALPVPGLASTIGSLEDNIWSGSTMSYVGVAAQYETGPWSVIAEGSQLWVSRSPLNARRGYFSVGWRHGPVTYYGLVSRVKPTRSIDDAPDIATSLTPLVGAAVAQGAQSLAGYAVEVGRHYRYDQSTVSAGLRWDFAANAAMKLQLDRFDVRSAGGAAWRFNDATASKGFLLSLGVDFVVGD